MGENAVPLTKEHDRARWHRRKHTDAARRHAARQKAKLATRWAVVRDDGYQVLLRLIGGRVRQVFLHRYIWEYDHGPVPVGFVVHHLDGNKDNNASDNLVAESRAQHSRRHFAEHFPAQCPNCGHVFRGRKVRRPVGAERGFDSRRLHHGVKRG